MRVLYLCPDLGIPVLGQKGASIHVRGLTAALRRAGNSVIVAASVLNKSPWECPAGLDASLMHLPPGDDVVAAVASLRDFGETVGVEGPLAGEVRRILHNQELGPRLLRRFRNHPPDVIYERASLYATAGALLAEALDRPLIVELNAPLALEHSTYRETTLGQLAARAERWSLSRADAVVVVSRALCDYAVSLGTAPSRIHVVRNGVDPALFRPGPPDAELRGRLRLDDGAVLGFIGGLRRWHGVEVLPRLLERLVPRRPNLRLVVGGDGPLRAELERDFSERGLGGSVVFTGSMPHEQVADVVRQFDVALAPYPPLEHAFYFSPLKLFEYMACGVPVVAPAFGELAEVMQQGRTGLLYTAGDLQGLTAACERLLDDPSLRDRLGDAGARLVADAHTWDDAAAAVTTIARSLIGGATAGEP